MQIEAGFIELSSRLAAVVGESHPTSQSGTSPVGSLGHAKPISNKLVGDCVGVVFSQLSSNTALKQLAVPIVKIYFFLLFSLGVFLSVLIEFIVNIQNLNWIPRLLHSQWENLTFYSDTTFSIQSLHLICLLCMHRLRWNPSDLHSIWLISPEFIFLSSNEPVPQSAGE